jgi:GDP-mannose 6-dehydrogenase
VDPNPTKVDLINSGKTPVIEEDIGQIISECVADGSLVATQVAREAIHESELSIVAVGTPSQNNGSLDLKFVRNVCKEIGRALAAKDAFHVVVMRSTMLPGSMRHTVIPTLEKYSGKRVGVGFSVCNNPEFLREGSAVYDYYHPPKTVIGATDTEGADLVASIYSELDAPLIRTDVETAEMVKYTDNVWHALKVSFANEIGNICKAIDIDGREVMDIFCEDTKLNLSPSYLKPGFAFGGSCLPKDVRALLYMARTMDLDVPLIDSILPSNQAQIQRGIEMITSRGRKKIGVLGFSFKAGTDDLRESPMVEVIERLIGKGYDVRLYDKNVQLACLVGANRDYILNQIPHISRLMEDSIEAVIAHAEVVVIGNGAKEFSDVIKQLKPEQTIIDFVRIGSDGGARVDYDGICW